MALHFSEVSLVGASLEVMDCYARKMWGSRPFVFTNMRWHEGLDAAVDFIARIRRLAGQSIASKRGK